MSIFRTILANIFNRNKQSDSQMPTEPTTTTSTTSSDEDPFALHDDTSRPIFGAEPSRPATPPAATQTTKTGRAYVILGTLDEVRNFAHNPPPRTTTVILAGALVMLSDTDVPNIDNYHRQTDRIVKSIGGLTKRSVPFTLKVWLHDDVIALKRTHQRHRFCFAIDQYLHYGRTQNTSLHLITGHSSDVDTIIHIFTFDNGTLTGIAEKILPARDHARFNTDYTALVASYRRNGHSVTIVDPMPASENDAVTYLDNSAYDKPISYFIVDQTSTPSVFVRHGFSMIVGITAIVITLGAMAIPYDEYSNATAAFRQIAATVPKEDLAFGSDQLKTMQERRLFLTDTRPQNNTVVFLRSLTTALSTGGIVIKSIAINRVKAQATAPDIVIVIETKRATTESVLDQGKPILDRLSAHLGLNFNLAHNGYQERTTSAGKIVIYNIEGSFKGNAQ